MDSYAWWFFGRRGYTFLAMPMWHNTGPPTNHVPRTLPHASRGFFFGDADDPDAPAAHEQYGQIGQERELPAAEAED